MAAKKLFILAGEASGDLHGANLIAELRALSPEIDVYGTGGERMREAGVKEFFDLASFHVTGFTSAIAKIPQYRRAADSIFESIRRVRPDLVILIDNPGFNLHMAQRIHALGLPIAYFIAPQVWAWAAERVKKIRKYVQKVLVVFEFEQRFFERHGVDAVWTGHPLKDILRKPIEDSKRSKKGPRIALLPGSRAGELQMLFPIFLHAALKLQMRVPELEFCVVKASSIPKAIYESEIREAGLPVEIIEDNGHGAIAESRLAIACSGTVTLECALLGTPAVIANKGSLITYAIAKTLIKVPYLGLPNLIAGREVFPELLQFDATPGKIADKAEWMLKDAKTYEEARKACEEVSNAIGPAGASRRAAEEILSMLSDAVR